MKLVIKTLFLLNVLGSVSGCSNHSNEEKKAETPPDIDTLDPPIEYLSADKDKAKVVIPILMDNNFN